MYTYTQVSPDVFAIMDGNVQMFLICGSKRALLLDSGYGNGDLRAFLKSLYEGPITLAHTHAHFDHVGGDGAFDEVWAHPGDWKELMDNRVPEEKLRALYEGDRIELGDRTIVVRETIGHSPGSLSFADEENGLLFVGDNVSADVIWMCMPGADLEKYQCSLEWTLAQEEWVKLYLCCHGEPKQTAEQIRQVIACVRAVREDRVETQLCNAYDDVYFRKAVLGTASLYLPL